MMFLQCENNEHMNDYIKLLNSAFEVILVAIAEVFLVWELLCI